MIDRQREGKKVYGATGEFRLIATRRAPAQMLLDDAGIGPVKCAKRVGFDLIEDGIMV